MDFTTSLFFSLSLSLWLILGRIFFSVPLSGWRNIFAKLKYILLYLSTSCHLKRILVRISFHVLFIASVAPFRLLLCDLYTVAMLSNIPRLG